MRKTILILSVLALLAGSCNQQANQKPTAKTPTVAKQQSSAKNSNAVQAQEINKPLEEMIISTIKAYQNRDEKTLNKLILKDFGIAFVFRRGVMDEFDFSNKISFAKPIPDYLPFDYNLIIPDYKIHFEKLPTFDCESEKWNKPHGIYCDTTNRDNILSYIAEFRNENIEGNYSAAEIKKFKEIEKRSYQVIVISKGEMTYPNVFVFYVTLYGKKWYLTIINRFEACSA